MRCGIFKKIANRAFIATAGKIFCESSGKNLVKSIIVEVEIFADGISPGLETCGEADR